MLDPSEQSKVSGVVRLGCLPATAAKFVGRTPEQLEEELQRNEPLARELLQSEAEAVVRHMGNIHKAANDEKNWRTSVWWLEQHARAGAQPEDAVSLPAAVFEALQQFAELIVVEIPDAARRQAVLMRLLNIAAESLGKLDVAQRAVAALTLPSLESSADSEETLL